MTFSVYLAASSAEIARAQSIVDRLTSVGITITSTWLANIAAVGSANPRDASREQRLAWTDICLAEVRAADLLWFLVPSVSNPTRGGWGELLYAHALGKELVCSGDTRQSIFPAIAGEFDDDEHALDFVVWRANAESLLAMTGTVVRDERLMPEPVGTAEFMERASQLLKERT